MDRCMAFPQWGSRRGSPTRADKMKYPNLACCPIIQWCLPCQLVCGYKMYKIPRTIPTLPQRHSQHCLHSPPPVEEENQVNSCRELHCDETRPCVFAGFSSEHGTRCRDQQGTTPIPRPCSPPLNSCPSEFICSNEIISNLKVSERLNEFRLYHWLVRPQCLLLYGGDEKYLHCKVALMTIGNTRFKPLAQSNPSGEYDLRKVSVSSWAPTRSLVWLPCLIIKAYHSSPFSLVLSRTQKSNFIFLTL